MLLSILILTFNIALTIATHRAILIVQIESIAIIVVCSQVARVGFNRIAAIAKVIVDTLGIVVVQVQIVCMRNACQQRS